MDAAKRARLMLDKHFVCDDIAGYIPLYYNEFERDLPEQIRQAEQAAREDERRKVLEELQSPAFVYVPDSFDCHWVCTECGGMTEVPWDDIDNENAKPPEVANHKADCIRALAEEVT